MTSMQIQHPSGKTITVNEEQLRAAGVDTSKPVESITQEQYDEILNLIGDQTDSSSNSAALPSKEVDSGAQFTITLENGDAHISGADGTTVVITKTELIRMNVPFENGQPVIDSNVAQNLAQIAIETMDSEKSKSTASQVPLQSAPRPTMTRMVRPIGMRSGTPTVRRVSDGVRGPRMIQRTAGPPPRVVTGPASTGIRRLGGPTTPATSILDRSQMIGKTVKFRDPTGASSETGHIVEYVEGKGYKVRKQNGNEFFVPPDSFAIKTPQSSATQPQDHQSYQTPSRPAPPISSAPTQCFDCAMCSKRINQKTPAYIVIRLPACDECAEQKILVNSVRESQVSSTTKPMEHDEPPVKKQKAAEDADEPQEVKEDSNDSSPSTTNNESAQAATDESSEVPNIATTDIE